MWTQENRHRYDRSKMRYPSDLTDAEWERLRPLIPAAKPGGRPRKTDMRSAMNAVLYLLRTGCPWRYLGGDLGGVARGSARTLGHEASPTAAVLDSQSLKSAEGAVRTTPWVTTPARR
jgi:hypothetical protein